MARELSRSTSLDAATDDEEGRQRMRAAWTGALQVG
jgi:hypothetical protein